MALPRGQKLSDIVVGAIMGAALIWTIFQVVPPPARWVLIGLLLYEAYTLINPFGEDTISESVWRLAERPMVPWLFGVATGYAIAAGVFGSPAVAVLSVAVGYLSGHFFFQRHDKKPQVEATAR